MGKDARLKRERRALTKGNSQTSALINKNGRDASITVEPTPPPEWIAAQIQKGNVLIRSVTGKTFSFPPKLYTPQEVVNIVDENTLTLLEFFMKWGEEDFEKLLQYMMELRDRISDVLGYVRRTEGKLVRRENTKQGAVYHHAFTDDEMGEIISLTLKLITVMERMGISREKIPELDDLLNAGEQIGLALGDLLANRDNGDALRQTASLYKPPSGAIVNWLTLTKTGPKPTDDAKAIRSWLRVALINALRNSPNQDKAYEAVRDDLEDRKTQLAGLELGAYQWIQKQEAKPKGDPCGTLWRDIRRKKNTQEEKTTIRTS